MNISKLTLAVATVLGTGATSSAYAIDLYVDVRTKQIFAEPGPHRERMGSFERVEDASAKAPATATESAELSAVKEDLALKTNEIKALQEHMEEAEKTEVKLGEKGLEIASKDKNFKMSIGGRLQFDGDVATGGQGEAKDTKTPAQLQQINDGTGVRRGRIHTEGTLYKDFDFKFEYDFVRGSGTTAAGITDAWIEYTNFKPFTATVGQFKEPFSLESVTSNRYLTFAERSLANNAFVEFANPYLLGFSAQSFGERWTARAALQAEPIGGGNYNANTSLNSQGNANRNGPSGNPTFGGTARVTYLPWFNSKTELVHLGASGSYRTVNNTNHGVNSSGGSPTSMRFASQVANVDRTNWADTGNLTNNLRELEGYYRAGAELAGVYGPFSIQSEFIGTKLNGKGLNGHEGYSSEDFLYGYYAYASWFMTGESRAYNTKKGSFDRQKPSHNFSLKDGGWGAWELAARWDSLDMNTKHVSGGRLQQGTIALNWYLNPHVRIMADYSHIFDNFVQGTNFNTNSNLVNTANQHPNIFMLRTQLDW